MVILILSHFQVCKFLRIVDVFLHAFHTELAEKAGHERYLLQLRSSVISVPMQTAGNCSNSWNKKVE